MTKVSVFPEGYWSEKKGQFVPANKPNEDVSFEDLIYRVKSGYWEDAVINVRSGRWQKIQAPYFTASGTFEYRNIKGLINHSGIICIDIDAKDNDEISIDEISADEYVYAVHESISGNGGYAVYIKIEPNRHLDAFLGLEKYFANKYKIIIDQACKDIGRARFVSMDENAVIIPNSKTFKKYIPKKKIQPNKTYVFTKDDLEHIFQQIKDRSINICEDYSDWVKVGMAFANTYSENGRDKFHFVSRFSTKYSEKETDKVYNGLLKRKRSENSIGSFFYLCQSNGVSIKTKKTETIERVAKIRRKNAKNSSGGVTDVKESAIKTLESSGIKREDSEPIINQVLTMPDYEIENDKSDDLISDLKAFLTGYNMRFNEITRKVEIDGKEIDDRILNGIYIRAKEVVSDKVNKDLLFSIIDSEFTSEYNPFLEFIEKNKHLKPVGIIEEFLSCIEYEANYNDHHVDNYLQVYVKKWLLSVVASMFGTHSEMILVLIGAQGERKTKFFRGLLPEDLQQYYAESKLDEGKDGYILMCEKLIIMDDEFGGKNKQEAKKIKELSSKSIFSIRRPYGKFHEDRRRLAVLCGTSNEGEIINDPTGNRRIIPVNIKKIDREKYESIDKTSLWMELYWAWKEAKEDWMLNKIEIEYLKEIGRVNEQPSMEEESIAMFFKKPDESGYVIHMTNTEILNYIETRTKLKISSYKLGMNLKKMGFEKKNMRIDGVVKMVYPMIERKPNE